MTAVEDRVSELTSVSAGVMDEITAVGGIVGELDGRRGELAQVPAQLEQLMSEIENIHGGIEDMIERAEADGNPTNKHREALAQLEQLETDLAGDGEILTTASAAVAAVMEQGRAAQRALGERRVAITAIQELVSSISEP